MLSPGNEGCRLVGDRTRSAVALSSALGRHSIVWPILMAREALAATDEVLAVLMKFVLRTRLGGPRRA
jgi:hypothetical protein